MKKHILVAFVALLGLGIFASLSLPPTPALANSTTLSVPGAAGRPSSDTVTNFREEGRINREMCDFSLGTQLTNCLSNTTQTINITSTAGLSTAATSAYPGNLYIYIVNKDPVNNLVAFVSMTSTAIAGITPAGLVVLANNSGLITCQARPGLTLHVQGLTGTATSVQVGIGNQ